MKPQDELANDIAVLLYAYWHHPAPSTRAQIEGFIARHLDGVTVQQLRECDLSSGAEVAQLRQENAQLRSEQEAMRTRHDLQLVRYEWQGLQQPVAVKMPDGYWTPWFIAEAVCLAQSERAEAAEAARDHLRARLRQLADAIRKCDFGHDVDCDRVTGSAQQDGDHFSFPIPGQRRCTCGLADLLAILEAPSEPPNEKEVDARVGTMGDGDTSRTASAVQAGSEEPMTPNQERNQPPDDLLAIINAIGEISKSEAWDAIERQWPTWRVR